MYHMKRATVRDLRYAFPRVEAELAAGEEIEIVKRGKVVAKLVPVEPPAAPKVTAGFLMARLRRIYGDRMSDETGAETIGKDRDEGWG
jgi:antitoxin (DNA-binding transcriptional repressor) of toxin-antitoxin stability system